VSEPYLGPVGNGGVDHRLIADTLQALEYTNWASVEMRHNPDVETLEEIHRVLVFLSAIYGG
jgi:sugar phosphate isomerase/epimerase